MPPCVHEMKQEKDGEKKLTIALGCSDAVSRRLFGAGGAPSFSGNLGRCYLLPSHALGVASQTSRSFPLFSSLETVRPLCPHSSPASSVFSLSPLALSLSPPLLRRRYSSLPSHMTRDQSAQDKIEPLKLWSTPKLQKNVSRYIK